MGVRFGVRGFGSFFGGVRDPKERTILLRLGGSQPRTITHHEDIPSGRIRVMGKKLRFEASLSRWSNQPTKMKIPGASDVGAR